MATVSITIPDAYLTDVVNAMCSYYDYNKNKLTNETQNAFAKRMLAEHVKQVYQSYTAEEAAKTARATSISTTNNVSIT